MKGLRKGYMKEKGLRTAVLKGYINLKFSKNLFFSVSTMSRKFSKFQVNRSKSLGERGLEISLIRVGWS